MKTRAPSHFIVFAVVIALALTACEGGQESGASPAAGTTRGEVEAAGVVLPSQIIGLTVQTEDVSGQLEKTRRAFIDNIGLFSMREEDLVRATLQVSRFSAFANYKDPAFRASIIAQLGGTRPVETKVSDTIVYITRGNEQNIFIWFEGRGMFILTVHQIYEFPRTLLRRILSVEGKV